MKAPQQWRLERMIYEAFKESGMEASHLRKSDSDSAVKAFIETVPQVPDPILTLLRFEAFVKGWHSVIDFERENDQMLGPSPEDEDYHSLGGDPWKK